MLLCSLYDLLLKYLQANTSESSSLLPILTMNNNDQKYYPELTSNLSPACPATPPKRTFSQQLILSFSAIENTKKLFSYNNRFAIFDTIRFVLTIGVYSLQTFNFQLLTLQMMRGILYTSPLELLHSNSLWFARAPGYFIDGFTFNL